MSSSVSMKQNPFTRSNPFHLQHQSHISSTPAYTPFQQKPTYTPQLDSYQQKQNTFIHRPAQQLWKFHDNNCSKVNVFNSQSYSRVGDKLLGEKNSFERELVMGNLVKKNNNNSGQQVGERIVDNPFARKYLMKGGKLVESQVMYEYVGQQQAPYQRYKTEHENYPVPRPLEHDNYRYNNYITPNTTSSPPYQNNPAIRVTGSSNNLQSSLNYNRDINQYNSRKSIERDDSYNKMNGSFSNINNTHGQSRYSIQKQKERLYGNYQSIVSNQNNYASNKNFQLSRHGSRGEKDDGVKVGARNADKDNGSRVKFDESDQENERNEKYHDRKSEQRAPRFGSRTQAPQLNAPEYIQVRGLKFYRQNVQSY